MRTCASLSLVLPGQQVRFVCLLLLLSSGWFHAASGQPAKPLPLTSLSTTVDPDALQIAAAPSGLATGIRDMRVQTPERYLQILREIGRQPAGRVVARDQVLRHVAALLPILPDSLQGLHLEQVVETGRLNAAHPRAGKVVTAWWRRQDPFPASPRNERLLEHLRRSQIAFDQYAREDDAHRLDDRGTVFIRFGKPQDRVRLTDVNAEFWVYPTVHDWAEYFFIQEQGEGFRLGRPTDVLPMNSSGHGKTKRGIARAIGTIFLMRDVYGTLAHYRSRYGPTYSDLAMYSERIQQAVAGNGNQFAVRPDLFALQKVQQIETREAYAAQRRERTVPAARSDVGGNLHVLPVGVRTIRTLNDDGTTSVSVVWGVRRSELAVSSEAAPSSARMDAGNGDRLLTASLVKQDRAFRTQGKSIRNFWIPKDQLNQRAQQYLAGRDSFLLARSPHAALQLDVFRAGINADSTSIRRARRAKAAALRFDDLAPLSNDGSLEMGDLIPRLLSRSETSTTGPPYPFRALPGDQLVDLTFDVYHLARREGRTDYSVEVEVFRKTERGRLRRLFGRKKQERTAVRSRYTGRSSNTKERIVLDPADWASGTPQDIVVTVRVRDEVARRSVERRIDFSMTSVD